MGRLIAIVVLSHTIFHSVFCSLLLLQIARGIFLADEPFFAQSLQKKGEKTFNGIREILRKISVKQQENWQMDIKLLH